MKRLRMLVTGVAAIAMLAAAHVRGETDTDENGVPMKLYPPGYDKTEQVQLASGVSAKASARHASIQALASPQGQASPNGLTAPDRQYVVVDLGLGEAYSINQAGDVSGYLKPSQTQASYPFIYSKGVVQSLTFPSGMNYVFGFINKNDHIGGWCLTMDPGAGFTSHGFIYANGVFQDIGRIGLSGEIDSMDDQDRLVGYMPMNDANTAELGSFLYSNGSMQQLNTLGGNSGVVAKAINNSGQMTGYFPVAGKYHAFLSTDGSFEDIGALNAWNGYGIQINGIGHVLGVSYDTGNSSASHIFLYSDGTMNDLSAAIGTQYYPYLTGINDLDEIVMYMYFNQSDTHGYLCSNRQLKDLNGLLVPGSSWVITSAYGINNSGQIAATANDAQGNKHAVRLDPNPCPILTIPGEGFHQSDGEASGVPAYFGKYGQQSLTAAEGCMLCSEANMLKTFGIPITPAELDKDLNDHDGYSSGDYIDPFAIGQAVGHSEIGAIRTYLSQATLEEYLEEHCCGNQDRVILGFKTTYTKNGVVHHGTHFIFVMGATQGDWEVFDPGWNSAWVNGTPANEVLGSLNGHLAPGGFSTGDNSVHWQFSLFEAIAYNVVNQNGARFNSVAQCPLELLVTDPNGNRVGYDPTTGNDVVEILGASYERQYPIANANGDPSSNGDTNGVKIINIPNPVGGTYHTKLIGTGPGNYRVDASTYWNGSSGQPVQTITGTTDVGSISTNTYFVIVPPIITASITGNNEVNLSFTSQSNVTYFVEGAESLVSTNWNALQVLTATDAMTTATLQSATNATMFYRIRSQ